MRIYFVEAVRSLLNTKLRTFLALIGIVIGIGSVIALVTLGRIVTHEATKQFREMGTDLVSARLQSTDNEDETLKSPDLFFDFARCTRCIRMGAPFTQQYKRFVVGEDRDNVDVTLFGAGGDFALAAGLTLSAGRFPSDLDGRRNYITLGAELPERLGLSKTDPASLIGKELYLEPFTYTIIGILAPCPDIRQIRARVNESAFAPIRSTLGGDSGTAIKQLLARMHPEADPARCVKEIGDYFKIRNPKLDVRITTAADLIERMSSQTRMLGVLLAAIGSISLVVGGVGIMNIMLVSVSERRQEIGIRRAMGARRRDIRYQFLVEALILSLTGGLTGILAGIAVSYGVANHQKWEFFVSMQPILLGAGVSGGIGIFFGFFPAHQAAKLDPIAALRGD